MNERRKAGRGAQPIEDGVLLECEGPSATAFDLLANC